ncbi:MAG: proline--tRNA ligase, partial [Clostridiales bacterium]|nr:proline--tRNA ligase [Clostridiales bacterium]
RDNFEKGTLPLEGIAQGVSGLLASVQQGMFDLAEAFRVERTRDVRNREELAAQVQQGYARAMWCGERACEDLIKEETGATSRNMPFDQAPLGGTCVCCGKKADKVMYFARAY